MDDYNGALNPITLRDGELNSASGEGWEGEGGAFRTSESSSDSLTHSLTHIHSVHDVCQVLLASGIRATYRPSPCTPLNVTYCGIPYPLQGRRGNDGCLVTLYLLATSDTELIRVLPCFMGLETLLPAHRSSLVHVPPVCVVTKYCFQRSFSVQFTHF